MMHGVEGNVIDMSLYRVIVKMCRKVTASLVLDAI